METERSMQQTSERIQQLWQQLQTIVGFLYSSQPGPGSKTGWQGEGCGQVEIQLKSEDELYFIERGSFSLTGREPIETFNTYIWQKTSQGIRLAHGRRGEPVFLFELVPHREHGLWRSAAAHVCVDDLYSGELREGPEGFDLQWTISGPKKDEHLFYHYSADPLPDS